MGYLQSSLALDRANSHLRKGKHRTTSAIARTTSGSAAARLRNREYALLHYWQSVLLPSPDDLRPQTPPQVFPLWLPDRQYLARIRGNKLESSSSAHRIQDLDQWAYQRGVTLDFSRPGKPTDNACIEAFNSRF